jgi:6-pyruvoyltetrahydropterin/6-carboxytetrahydropterin synthase
MQNKTIVCRGAFKTYNYELTFDYSDRGSLDYQAAELEVKRLGIEWISETLGGDTLIQNPVQPVEEEAKVWYMSLNGKDQDCEPTLQNIVKEIFLAMAALFEDNRSLQIHLVTAYEPQAGFATCVKETITPTEANKWLEVHYATLKKHVEEKNTTIVNPQQP